MNPLGKWVACTDSTATRSIGQRVLDALFDAVGTEIVCPVDPDFCCATDPRRFI